MLGSLDNSPSDAAVLLRRHVGTSHNVQGASQHGFLAYQVIAMFCFGLVGIMFGIRSRHLRLTKLRSMNPARLLVLGVYIISLLFIYTLNVLQTAVGLAPPSTCYASIMVCLALYFANKACLYVFLVERAHAARAAYRPRLRDWVWCAGMAINVIGITAILTNAFISTTIDMEGGVCHILLAEKCVLMALAFDVFVNAGLTGIFVIALLPALRFNRSITKHESPAAPTFTTPFAEKGVVCSRASLSSLGRSPPAPVRRERATKQNRSRLDRLFRKTVIGTCLVLLPTIANLVILTIEHGDEPAWFCLTICTLDVTAQVCVVFWLTVDPIAEEQESINASRAAGLATSGSVIAVTTTLPRSRIHATDDDITSLALEEV